MGSSNDGSPGSDATAPVTVTVVETQPGINFNDHTIGSYGVGEDNGGVANDEHTKWFEMPHVC